MDLGLRQEWTQFRLISFLCFPCIRIYEEWRWNNFHGSSTLPFGSEQEEGDLSWIPDSLKEDFYYWQLKAIRRGREGERESECNKTQKSKSLLKEFLLGRHKLRFLSSLGKRRRLLCFPNILVLISRFNEMEGIERKEDSRDMLTTCLTHRDKREVHPPWIPEEHKHRRLHFQ